MFEAVELKTRDLHDEVEATVVREFYLSELREALLGRMTAVTLCEGCYLHDMESGEKLVVVTNDRSSTVSFHTFDRYGNPKHWEGLNYRDCRRISKRQATAIGRLLNRIEYRLRGCLKGR